MYLGGIRFEKSKKSNYFSCGIGDKVFIGNKGNVERNVINC